MKIRKRNGQLEEFRESKIRSAITMAFIDCGADIDSETLESIIINVKVQDEDHVEVVQDKVINAINEAGFTNVAKSYKDYRVEHQIERERKYYEKLAALNIQNQNANVDEASFGGRIGEASRVMTKDHALEHCVSKMAKLNHLNNEIYIHDLDSYSVGMHNCLSIPFDDLLNKGFNTRQTDVRPANSINTAFQLVAVIFQLQSLQQFGGVSATHLDWTMVPYVRKSFYKHWKDGLKFIENKEITLDSNLSIGDSKYKEFPKVCDYALEMTNRELQQAVEGMYHNLNTLQSRSGNQLPFTSINFGTCTLPEGRMVIKALLTGSIKGVGKYHRTPIFPCSIFQYMKGVNNTPGTPNYDMYKLALESTSKRLYPNYANVDWSGNIGYDKNDPRTYFSTMGK